MRKGQSDGYCFIDGTNVRLEDVCDEFEIQEVKEGKRGSEMTNREWMNSLSAEELGTFLGKAISQCSLCHYQDIPECSGNCEKGTTKWLNAKHENPMPEIKAGDLLFYGKGNESYYVAIAPGKLVTLRGYVVVDLENAIRNDSIIAVSRYTDGTLTTIWRADNEFE